MQLNLNEQLALQPDWHAVKLTTRNKIYVNIKQNLFSLSPVLSLDRLDFTLNVIEAKVDMKALQKTLRQLEA